MRVSKGLRAAGAAGSVAVLVVILASSVWALGSPGTAAVADTLRADRSEVGALLVR